MVHHRLLSVLGVSAVIVSATAVSGSAATPPKPLTRQEIAQRILDSPMGRLMTAPARTAVEMQAHGDRQAGHDQAEQGAVKMKQAEGGHGPDSGQLTNILVNNPAEDSHQPDQTTQSETAIAVSGSSVAVGFNDSQHTLIPLTAGTNLTGYAYSRDGGRSFTDGGVVPNPLGMNNLGDPWLGSDRSGAMYYSTLSLDFFNAALGVGVAKSTDGGKTWSQPVIASPQGQFFYTGDKDALTTGPDPLVTARDNIYVAWDDTSFFSARAGGGGGGGGGGPLNGLAVATSRDGGATYSLAYADRIPFPDGVTNCNFGQYIGAQPLVDRSTGTLYVAAEKIYFAQSCPPPPPPPASFGGGGPGGGGTGGPEFSEVIFKSTDGGAHFDRGTTIATISPTSGLMLGPGQIMRTAEFPTLAMRGGNLYATWNDTGAVQVAGGGVAPLSHIRLATSRDGGTTWTTSWVTAGANDEVQPSISSDSSGIHILYYQRNGDNTLDVNLANSADGAAFTTQRVTSQSFPGVFTVPQFDPVIAQGYMGDYIASVSDGSSQYFAWGDNRNLVTNFLWEKGRHDPDVFFARRGSNGNDEG